MPADFHENAKAGVQGRARVQQLVATDVRAAIERAEAIEHPWYRSQALATASTALSDPDAARAVLERAIAAAHELTEPNRIVTVASGPIRALVERGLGVSQAEIDRLLAIIATEPHTLRRADALFHLFRAVYGNRALRERVRSALLAALARSHGWRAARLTRFTALLVAADDAASARRIVETMTESREKRRAVAQLERMESPDASISGASSPRRVRG